MRKKSWTEQHDVSIYKVILQGVVLLYNQQKKKKKNMLCQMSSLFLFCFLYYLSFLFPQHKKKYYFILKTMFIRFHFNSRSFCDIKSLKT